MSKTNALVHTNSAFRYHWTVWRLTGIRAPANISKIYYTCYGVFINVFVTILFPLTLIANLFHTHNNLQQLCENLTITVTDTIANLKFLNVFVVRSKLLLIEDILKQLDKRATSRQERNALRQAVNTAQNSFRVFWFIYTIGTCLSLIKVVLSKERTLLYPAWFYIDWQSSNTAYALILAYQLFGLIVQAFQDCANDSYPPAYLCVLTGHMKALEIRIRNIDAPMHEPLSKSVAEKNYCNLLACIDDHLNVLKLHSIIQFVLSKACLAQFICSALVQCTVGLYFLYVVDEQNLSAQILAIIFFIGITLEVLIICYYGHYMRVQSEALCNAFYSCNWIEQLPKFKRNLIITLLRTQRPCVILAGNYITVDLATFLQLMKYTYSAFTLLMRFK